MINDRFDVVVLSLSLSFKHPAHMYLRLTL